MASEDAENKDMEVNVLDELLENADDDDLAAELKDEEKKCGKKTPVSAVTPPLVKATLATSAIPKKKSTPKAKKPPSVEVTVSPKKATPAAKTPAPKSSVPAAKKKAVVSGSTAESVAAPVQNSAVAQTALDLSTSAAAQAKPSSQPKLVQKIPTKITKSSGPGEKGMTVKAKPVVSATGEPKMSPEDLLASEAAPAKGMVIKKTVAKKILTTVQTPNKIVKKLVAVKPGSKKSPDTAAVAKPRSDKAVLPSKTAVPVPPPSKHSPDEDPDRLHVTPTAEELQVAEDTAVPPPMVASSAAVPALSSESIAAIVSGGAKPGGGGPEKRHKNPDYDTRSEASSSEHESCSCSLGSSTSRSRSRSRSRSQSFSGSSSLASGPTEHSPRQHVSRKRRHSPIVYDRKNRSAERAQKRSRFSSSSRREHSEPSDHHLVKYFFRNARFFLVKSNNHENVALSKAKGVWSTPPQNEAKLNQAFRECKNVILVYSVKESGKFQGFARLASESTHNCPPIQWVLPPGLSARALGGVFHVDWICRRELPFTKTTHLYNPWNEGKQVKIGRDGQEIEPRVAEELCRLFPVDELIDLRTILHRSGRSSRRRHHSPSRRSSSRHRRHHRGGGGSNEDARQRHTLARLHSRRSHASHSSRSPRPRHRRDSAEEGYRLARRVRYSGEHEIAMDRFQVRREPPPMNGGYQDYLREYHHHQRPPMPPMPYGPPPPFPMEAMSYHYERAIQHIDYNHGVPPRPPRVLEKRSYEMTVDDFIRRTARPPPSRAERSGRYRERR
ncbi:YTH domain-containing protein 1 isoform X2 [Ixodes scapularis]|uniref:YTH domain-containing protein 1 isoform X2 n=1 Tax=Ixodes scapularis TaxID=6945 RepID=UPI001A9D1549|nr:YTH domain-containing protein 1 isoform X2 [Ixodes scapularis]